MTAPNSKISKLAGIFGPSAQEVVSQNSMDEQEQKRQIIKYLFSVLGTSVLAGGGFRGLTETGRLLRGGSEVDPISSVPEPLPIAIPDPARSKKKKKRTALPVKLGAAGEGNSIVDWFANRLPWRPDTLPPAPKVDMPSHSADVRYDPMTAAMAFTLASSGFLGGMGLADKTFDWLRRRGVKRQEERAKEDYRQALQAQYEAALQQKTGNFHALYAHYNEMPEKTAGWKERLYNFGMLGPAGGFFPKNLQRSAKTVMILAALGTAALAARQGYKWTRQVNRGAALDAAIRRRGRERALPQPIFAVSDEGPYPEFSQKALVSEPIQDDEELEWN